MSPFLEKLVSFFMIESPDPEDPVAPKKPDEAAAVPAAPPVQRTEPAEPVSLPPVHRIDPADIEPAKPAALPPVHRIDSADLEPPAAAKPAPAAPEKPEKPAAPVRGEKPEQPAPASAPSAQDAAQPPKKRPAAKRPAAKKPAETPAPAAEPAPDAEAPAPSEAPAAPEQSGGFRDKIRAFFFPNDSDADAELSMQHSRDGRRPVGTRVRVASHRFTTVTEQDHRRDSGCKPLDEEAISLLKLARVVRSNAYAKYSGFQVGAALKAASGKVYFGVNVENASYPAGICAERAAFTAAVTAGERQFTAIAIVGGDESEPCFPCGICRQVLMELCPPDMPVILESGIYRLDSLLPHAFQFTNR